MVNDPFLHSEYPDTKGKISIRKADVASFCEDTLGTKILTLSNDYIIISMSYDDVKKELTETIC